MLWKPFGPLVPTLLSAALLAGPTPALSFPFFGKSGCKDEKRKLHHEEQILRDRQQLALHQCHATLDESHDRCQSLKRRHRDELKRFEDRRKSQLAECKARTSDKRVAKDVRKDVKQDAKKDAKKDAKQGVKKDAKQTAKKDVKKKEVGKKDDRKKS